MKPQSTEPRPPRSPGARLFRIATLLLALPLMLVLVPFAWMLFVPSKGPAVQKAAQEARIVLRRRIAGPRIAATGKESLHAIAQSARAASQSAFGALQEVDNELLRGLFGPTFSPPQELFSVYVIEHPAADEMALAEESELEIACDPGRAHPWRVAFPFATDGGSVLIRSAPETLLYDSRHEAMSIYDCLHENTK